MLMNIGEEVVILKVGLLIIIVWGINGKVYYVLEGSVFIVGVVIQWLRDGLKLIDELLDFEYYVMKMVDMEGVYVVFVFVGLGVLYWDMYVCGVIFGLMRGISKVYLIRVMLEFLVYQIKDVLDVMEKDLGIKLKVLKVDGGVLVNNFLM